MAQFVQLGEIKHGAFRCADPLEHFQEAKILADVIDHEAQHEAVEQRRQLFFVGEFVGRAEHRDERDGDTLAPVVKDTFVDERQQRVEDRGVGLEDLVEKRDMRLGELVVSHAAVIVLLETLQAHRAEDLLGRAELRQQPLEVVGAPDSPA